MIQEKNNLELILDQIEKRLTSIESLLKQIQNEKAILPYQLFTSIEVAQALQITTRHLQNLREQQLIDFVQAGRNVRFKPEHVKAYIEEHTISSRSHLKRVA